MKIIQIKENFKKSYVSHGNTLYIHGIKIDGGDKYEIHSKTEKLKYKVGDEIPDSQVQIEEDKFGNKKLKTIKPGATPSSQTVVSSPKNNALVWAQLFTGVASFAASKQLKIADLKKATDELFQHANSL